MQNRLKNTALVVAIAATMAGCAHTQNPEKDDKSHRTRNVLIAVGSTIAIGVLMGKKAQSNARDAIGNPSEGE